MTSAPRRSPTLLAIAWLLVTWLAGAPAGAAAQGALAMACRDAGGVALACTEAAVAARAVQGHVVLLGALGSEVPGSAGTLGRRLGTTPRVSLSARASLASVGVPDPSDAGSGPAREAGFILPALHGSVSVGLFDGFSPAPTVGGVLAVDLIGSAAMVFLPSGQGFDGSTPVLTLGARVGILRESFTLPGAAVSLTRRFGASARLGELNAGDRWTATVEPTVTSIRATVGKDLLGVGLLAGVGWDHHGGEATLELPTGAGAGTDDFETTRRLIFGGASVTFLVLQISGELGWAEGFAEVPSYRNVPFDLAGGTVWASLAFRLTL